MDDYLSPISLARFRGLEVDEPTSDSPDPPNRQGSWSALAWLQQYISAYLEQLPWNERQERLLEALADRSVEVVFGETDLSSRDLIWAQGFAKDFSSLDVKEQAELKQKFTEILQQQLEQEIAEGCRRSYVEGQTEADHRFTVEIEGLKGEILTLKRRLRVFRSKVAQVVLFGLLLVGSVGFTVWLVGLLDPRVAQVTIEYNVGEIIAAILGGVGAAAAGIGYATKTLRSTEDRDKSNE